MANPEQLEILQRGVAAWNLWRKPEPKTAVDLTTARLAGIDFRNANLKRATLRGTDLSGVDLSWANLIHVTLSEAILVNLQTCRRPIWSTPQSTARI